MQKRIRVFRPFQRGDRVVVNEQAGFHKGARGVIDYITPDGRIWIIRDGSSSPLYWHAFELEFENPEDGYCMSNTVFEKALTEKMSYALEGSSYAASFNDGARWAWNLAQEIFEKQSST
jgi:hypothetical protein